MPRHDDLIIEREPLRWLLGAILCALILGLILYASQARGAEPQPFAPGPRMAIPLPKAGEANCLPAAGICVVRKQDFDEANLAFDAAMAEIVRLRAAANERQCPAPAPAPQLHRDRATVVPKLWRSA